MSSGAIARVRVYYSGKRYIGEVGLPSEDVRLSDVLNNRRPFLSLRNAQAAGEPGSGGPMALYKGRITFIQVIDETPRTADMRIAGRFVPVDISMEQLDLPLKGKLFLPDGVTSLDQVINDDRDFLSLSEVEVGSTERYPYLAVAKGQVVAIRMQGLPEREVAPAG
jgi:hypothetical protein